MEPLRDKNGLTEEEFLAGYKQKNYPKPSLTADLVIFRREGAGRTVLLVQRGGHPYLGRWALPGGFAEPGETIRQTAERELEEETGVTGVRLQLVDVFSKPGRDPRGWTVSAAFTGTLEEDVPIRAGDDAAAARWMPVCLDHGKVRLAYAGEELEELAFDHMDILREALELTKE